METYSTSANNADKYEILKWGLTAKGGYCLRFLWLRFHWLFNMAIWRGQIEHKIMHPISIRHVSAVFHLNTDLQQRYST